MSNPYAPTEAVAVQNRQTTTTDVIDVETGQRSTIGGTTITISVNPVTGERDIEERTVRVRSDGRIINPQEPVYSCGCGCNTKPLLTSHTVRFCTFCQVPLALNHTRNWNDGATSADACPTCWTPGRRMRALKRFVAWLTHL